MITLELLDELFFASICAIALFGSITPPLLLTGVDEKMKVFCTTVFCLGTFLSVVALLLKVCYY